MGGHVPLMFDGPATSLPMIKSGKLKAYAVSSPKRMSVLPDVPTFTELGFPQLDATGWIGLLATPDVPAESRPRFGRRRSRCCSSRSCASASRTSAKRSASR